MRKYHLIRRYSSLLLGLCLFFTARLAAADGFFLSDIGGESEEAQAASLLLRTLLTSPTHTQVPLTEMRAAIDKAGGKTLVVPAGKWPEVMKAVGAERGLSGDLVREQAGLVLTLHTIGPTGGISATVTLRAPRGEVAHLAEEGAKAVAQTLGIEPGPIPDISLGDLRPYLRAQDAFLRGDFESAGSALQAASPDVAEKFPAARQIATQIANQSGLSTETRIAAALLIGNTAQANQLAAADSKNPNAKVQLLRGRIAAGDIKKADKELDKIKGADPLLVNLARAEIFCRQGNGGNCEKELVPLLQKTPPHPSALQLVSSLPSGVLKGETEALVITAAQRSSKTHSELASRIGIRAVQMGARTADTLGLISADDLRRQELKDVQTAVSGDTSTLANNLKTRLAEREQAPQAQLAATEPGTSAAGQAGAALAVSPAETAPPLPPEISQNRVEEIANVLVPLFESFPVLAEHPLKTSIVVYPLLQSGEPWWSLRRTHPLPLRFAISHALTTEPYHIKILEGGRDIGPLDGQPLAPLARSGSGEKAQFALFYELHADGDAARIKVYLYDAKEDQLYQNETLAGGRRTGLVRYNPLIAPLIALILGLLFFWIAKNFIFVGTVLVEMKADPGAEDAAFIVEISKSGTPVPITDVIGFHERVIKKGIKRSRYQCNLAPLKNDFSRIQAGIWFVHLRGTQVKGGEIRPLRDGLIRRVEVRSGRTAHVEFDLDPQATEYRLSVTDDGPVYGAKIYVDDQIKKAVVTDPEGFAVVQMPRGHHVIHVETKDLHVEKTVGVVGGKIQSLHIDLARERRQADVVLADLEGDTPEAPAAVYAQAESQHRSAPGAVQEDEGVSLPEDFQISFGALGASPTAEEIQKSATLGAMGTGFRPKEAKDLAPAAARPTSNSNADRYQKISELGRGAMGVVFRGRDAVLDRDVAIKIISDEVRQNPQALEMFFQEARAMAALNHPNLVTVFDQGEHDNETFLVMEFIEGQTLEKLQQQRGTLSVREVLTIGEQIASGLAYAHSRRILHRDIKPANIFVSKDGVVKIGDFGLARAIRQVELTHTKICGTPLYMSPEQIRGSGVDLRSDLYSVGCTLFELLTGQPPFTSGEVMYHHMYTPPSPPSEINPTVPTGIDQVILSCLEKDVNARVQTAQNLRETLLNLRAQFAA